MLCSRKQEYEVYLKELGMSNVSIHAEKLMDVPTNANFLERVIAVFATPPNSYSALSDPVDLVSKEQSKLQALR